MLKKIITLGCSLLLIGCHTTPAPERPFPAEFLGADYILSDNNAQHWVKASYQAEQCIYPNLTRIQQQHFSEQDAYIHAQYVLFYPLENIIGEQYVKMIQEDEKSMGYAQQQFKKYRGQTTEPLPQEKCEKLRIQARDDLAVLKGQYKSGMVEENKENSEKGKTTDNVATNDNKFFFDIIKWGATLLL